ncbi:MAG: hypothetical protein RDV41_07750 [Planctomycetota bacterium]|nr:hypothetical protein [Planctomycetota bacterium]
MAQENGSLKPEDRELEDSSLAERRTIESLLRELAAKIRDAAYEDIAAEHLDSLLAIMSYLQQHPEEGLSMVCALYEESQEVKVRGLLVFVASAARDCPETLDFFCSVMSDKAQDPSVRLACVYALAMANLQIAGGGVKVKGHYCTVLWAIGAMLRSSEPRNVYVSMAGRRPWPLDVPFGWQGRETRKAVLRIIMNSFESEPCPRVRYVAVGAVTDLEDGDALAKFWLRAYETETWTVPEGHFCAGANVARNCIVRLLADRAVKSKEQALLEALRTLYARQSPWDEVGSGYYDAILEAYEKLGWIDKAFIQHTLEPYINPELGKFPSCTGAACVPLRNAHRFYTSEEISSLWLQVVRVATANYQDDSRRTARVSVLLECLSTAEGLSSENEICRILLFHPYDVVRCAAVKYAAYRRLDALRDDMLRLACTEKNTGVLGDLEEALGELAPEELAALREQGLFKIPTPDEQLDQMLREGKITLEEWEYFRKTSAEREEQGQGEKQPKKDE